MSALDGFHICHQICPKYMSCTINYINYVSEIKSATDEKPIRKIEKKVFRRSSPFVWRMRVGRRKKNYIQLCLYQRERLIMKCVLHIAGFPCDPRGACPGVVLVGPCCHQSVRNARIRECMCDHLNASTRLARLASFVFN